MVEAGLGEDDGVVGVGAPQLQEVHGVAKPQARVAAEHHTGLQKQSTDSFVTSEFQSLQNVTYCSLFSM